jgi:hypothetical protein
MLPTSFYAVLRAIEKEVEQGHSLWQDSKRIYLNNMEKKQSSFKVFLPRLPMDILTQACRSLT